MKRHAKEVQRFFYTQAFADGLRITAAILLPSVILSYFGHFALGLSMSLGATCVSITDAPGPVVHKRNGMIYCTILIFITAIVTAYARMTLVTMGIEIVLFSFLFSMFTVYGTRAGSVGSACMLVLILTMDQPVNGTGVFIEGGLIFAGGLWYLLFSLLFHKIRPYRPAQRALGECIRETAAYLAIKADFYNTSSNLEENYKKLLAQQVEVSGEQDAVREILFKTRQIIKENSSQGRRLVLAFVDAVDLFEHITATYYDYQSLREKYAYTGILDEVAHLAKDLAKELDEIGIAIQSNTSYIVQSNINDKLVALKIKIDAVVMTNNTSNLVLKKLLVNMRNLHQRLGDVTLYFNPAPVKKGRTPSIEYLKFVTHQSFDSQLLLDNFSLKSSIFRHSLRVCIACIAGYIIANIISYGHHSYWIIMTVAFILRPAFGLTTQRNYQRILGTISGGLVGVLILLFVLNKTALFLFLVLFMLGNYSFQRLNYLAMVFCTTPFVFILFKLMGYNIIDVATERIIDTVIGCILAFAANYFLFPSWESKQVKTFLEQMLKANFTYFQKLVDAFSGIPVKRVDYKLARKEVYVCSANLSAAFQRMLSEPKSRQTGNKQLHQFVVLNHIFFFNAASLAPLTLDPEKKVFPLEIVQTARKTLSVLKNSIKQLDEQMELTPATIIKDERGPIELTNDQLLIKEQLEFIYRLTGDIDKVTTKILAT